MKKVILAMTAIAALMSCTKNESTEIDTWNGELSITSAITTRAVDVNWESGDAIGVTMTTTGSSPEGVGKANTQYSTTSTETSASFSVVSPDVPLYYPQSSNIDLMAYYPYVNGVDASAYELDVTTQTPSKNIDLMIATATDVEKSKEAIALTFDHKLSKVVITLTPATGGGLSVNDLDGMATELSGTIAKGSYDLNELSIDFGENTVEAITLPTTDLEEGYEEKSVSITAIVIPQEDVTPKFTFTLSDTSSYAVTASEFTFVGASEHNFYISITKTGATITGYKINPWNDGDDVNDLVANEIL